MIKMMGFGCVAAVVWVGGGGAGSGGEGRGADRPAEQQADWGGGAGWAAAARLAAGEYGGVARMGGGWSQ